MSGLTRVPIYKQSPFIQAVLSKTKDRIVYAGHIEKFVDPKNGKEKPMIIGETKTVDPEKFVKFYEGALIAMTEVNKTALQLFYFMIDTMELNNDSIKFNIARYAEDTGRSKSQVYRLIRELIAKSFIARKVEMDEYFININLVCKGNRMVIIRDLYKGPELGELEANQDFDKKAELPPPEPNPKDTEGQALQEW